MATTLADLNNLINDRRRDTGSNSTSMTGDGFRAINSVINLWQQMHDWEFTIEKQIIQYNEGITRYALNSDNKRARDIKYYKGSQTQNFDMVGGGVFDSQTLKTHRFGFETIGQTERIRLKANGNKADITTATSYNGDGTWIGASGASNIATDSYECFEQPASTSFDLTTATAATITNSTVSSKDISSYENRGNFYFNIYLPTITSLTSITIKIGSSASNYWTTTVTTDYIGDSFSANNWNKCKGTFTTSVGTPDASAITYIQVTLTYSGATTATGYRIENFFVSENVPILYEYYSNNFCYDVSGTTKVSIFNDSAATTDYPLFSGKWDYISEPFINSVLEIIFWMTGEYNDFTIARTKVLEIVTDLKKQLPSKKRYPEMQFTLE